MSKQDFLNAQAACIGGGTVLENADKWPTPELAPNAEEFLDTLSRLNGNAVKLSLRTRLYGQALTRDEARELMTRILINAQAAYRLLHIAIGDPMFKPEELSTEPLPFETNPEWPGEPNE